MVCVAVSENYCNRIQLVFSKKVNKPSRIKARVDDETVAGRFALAQDIAIGFVGAQYERVYLHLTAFLKVKQANRSRLFSQQSLGLTTSPKFVSVSKLCSLLREQFCVCCRDGGWQEEERFTK